MIVNDKTKWLVVPTTVHVYTHNKFFRLSIVNVYKYTPSVGKLIYIRV